MSRVIRLNNSQKKSLKNAIQIAIESEGIRAKEPLNLRIKYLADLVNIKNKITTTKRSDDGNEERKRRG